MAGGGTPDRLGAGFLQLLRLLPRVSSRLTVLLVGAVLAAGLLPLAFILVSGFLVGSVPAAIGAGWRSPEAGVLFSAAIATGAVYLLQQAAPLGLSAAADALALRLSGELQRRAMVATLRRRGIAHLEDPRLLDVVTLARNVVPGGFDPAGAVAGLATAVSSRLSVIGSAVIVASYSIPLAIFLFTAWLVTQVVLARMVFALARGSTGRQADTRRATYFRDLGLTPRAAKESRIFGLGGWIEERFRKTSTLAVSLATDEIRRGRRGLYVALVVRAAAMMVSIAVVARAAARGEIEIGMLAVLIGAIQGALFTQLGFGEMQAAYGAAAVPALLALEEAAATESNIPYRHSTMSPRPLECIRFESVSFAYATNPVPVFTDFDLEVRAGERLAVVGVNGAGKTTLAKLLAGLYEPTAGRVTVDGIDLREVDASAWRRQLAMLFQDFIHYRLTAQDNVGLDLHESDHDTMNRALARAGATDVVDGLAHGWATPLSPGVAGGTDLSGGQWQKLAIARALFAVERGAQVLVLDEPTANLDVQAEAEIYDRFLMLTSQAAPDRPPLTTIVISHRFSTVRRADRIVVLEGGRVVEDGAHDELVALGGRYAAMFRAQADRFEASVPTAAIEVSDA